MKFRLLTIVAAIALLVGTAFAHGDKVHVLGSLEKVTADSVSVKTKDGKTVEVKLVSATVYILKTSKEEKPARHSDLAVGDLVVIHATPKTAGSVTTLEAAEVKFSLPNSASAAAMKADEPKPPQP